MTPLFPSYYSLFSMLNSGEVKYYFTVIQKGKRHLLLCYLPNCYCCFELEQNSGENVKLATVITATVVESLLKPNRQPPPPQSSCMPCLSYRCSGEVVNCQVLLFSPPPCYVVVSETNHVAKFVNLL